MDFQRVRTLNLEAATGCVYDTQGKCLIQSLTDSRQRSNKSQPLRRLSGTSAACALAMGANPNTMGITMDSAARISVFIRVC